MRWIACSALLLLAGCNSGPGYVVDPHPISAINGVATFNEPIPVYEEYDGFEPLDSQMFVGLFDPLTGRLYQASSRSQTDSDQLAIPQVSFGFEMSRYFFPEGQYELRAFVPEALGENLGDGWMNGFVPRLFGRALPFTFTYGQDYQGLALDSLFPLGSSDRVDLPVKMLIHGNPPERGIVQVLLKPASPTPGVIGDTGLLWSERGDGWRDGSYDFTIPNVPAENYIATYVGYHFRDPGDPLQVAELPLSVQQGATLELAVSTRYPQQRPAEHGSISGTFRFRGAPPADATIMAVRSDPPPLTGYDFEREEQERYRHAFWHPLPDYPYPSEDVEIALDFLLGWLEPGTFSVILTGSNGAELDRQDGIVITAAAPEVTGVEMEE